MEVEDLIKQLQPEVSTSIRLVKEFDENIGQIARLVVEQRRLNPEEPRPPVRSESKPIAHLFYDVSSFIAYLSKYGGSNTVVFANPDNGSMQAVMDEKAKSGFEIITCKPMLHPLWRPWEELVSNDKSVSLDEFVSFLLQHRRVVKNGRELALELGQITATTTVELHRGRGKSAVNGLIVKTKIQGQEATNLVELPDSITLECPIFVNTKVQVITIDLTIDVVESGQRVVVALSSGDLAAAKVSAIESMFAAMTALTEKGMTVSLGAPVYGQWEYLKEVQKQ